MRVHTVMTLSFMRCQDQPNKVSSVSASYRFAEPTTSTCGLGGRRVRGTLDGWHGCAMREYLISEQTVKAHLDVSLPNTNLWTPTHHTTESSAPWPHALHTLRLSIWELSRSTFSGTVVPSTLTLTQVRANSHPYLLITSPRSDRRQHTCPSPFSCHPSFTKSRPVPERCLHPPSLYTHPPSINSPSLQSSLLHPPSQHPQILSAPTHPECTHPPSHPHSLHPPSPNTPTLPLYTHPRSMHQPSL